MTKSSKENPQVPNGRKNRRKQKQAKRLQDTTNTRNLNNLMNIEIKQDCIENLTINLNKDSTKNRTVEVNKTNEPKKNLRFVIIDGSNVGMAHGIKKFSSYGVKLAVEFFKKRGHEQIKVLVPRYRRTENVKDGIVLDELETNGVLSYTPSRYLNGKLIIPYDDRFILEAAEHFNAIIVSNDNYSDIKNEKPEWRKLVDNNLLQFTFVGDLFMVAKDPMGRYGPTLDQFLSDNFNHYQSNKKSLPKQTKDESLIELD